LPLELADDHSGFTVFLSISRDALQQRRVAGGSNMNDRIILCDVSPRDGIQN
jgi:hypothetical protein